jgi:hypothetical protein
LAPWSDASSGPPLVVKTENLFTINILEDYIHGVMAGKRIVQYNRDSEELKGGLYRAFSRAPLYYIIGMALVF